MKICTPEGTVLFESSHDTLKATLEAAAIAKADLRRANLVGANLVGANLRGANLGGADLSDAYLVGADLRGANLRGADLVGANLVGANLGGADLRGADLSDAYLRDADLRDADLVGAKPDGSTTIDTGERLSVYREMVVPELIASAGKTMKDVREAWNCHKWENCPMHVAFGIASVHEGPILLRPRIQQFVQLFDAGWLPAESIPGLIEKPADAAPTPATT